jgi:hypothetical protein
LTTGSPCGTTLCPNPEPCAETWSDCCVIHNGDSFSTAGLNKQGAPFVINQGDRLCDIMQRFFVYYNCGDDTGLPIPYGLKSGAITTTTINFSWAALTGASYYEVQVAPVSTGLFNVVGTVTANTTPNFTVTGLTPNTSYYLNIIPYDIDDNTGCTSVSLILTTKQV